MDDKSTAVNDAPSVENTESAPVEDNFPSGFDDYELSEDDKAGEKPAESEDSTDKEEESPQEEQTEEAVTTEEPETPKDSSEWENLTGKSQDRFRQMANERNDLQRQMEELKAKQSQFATERQLLDEVNPDTGEYYTPDEVARIGYYQRLEAQGEQVKQQEYQMQVRMNQTQLASDAERALNDFPMFNDKSADYDPELSKLVEPILEANAVTDPNTGEVIGMRVSPYDLLKTYHDALSRNSQHERTVGVAKAQKAAQKMMTNADHLGSSSQASKGSDTEEFINNFFD